MVDKSHYFEEEEGEKDFPGKTTSTTSDFMNGAVRGFLNGENNIHFLIMPVYAFNPDDYKEVWRHAVFANLIQDGLNSA